MSLIHSIFKVISLLVLLGLGGQSFAIDTDNDGLPDDWELANGRNPLVADYQVSTSGGHTCALDDTGVVCWGYNGSGEIDVPVLSNPTQVSLGGGLTCALDDTGLVCWGYNGAGATDVPVLSNPTQVSLGGEQGHTCALDDTGVVCWGYNYSGQTNVPALSNPTQVSLGGAHTCALDDSGVVCWGRNNNGQTDVPALSNPTQVSLGYWYTCALDDTGVVCWGRNNEGQTDVPALNNPTQVSLGNNHTCALDDSGVVCWGLNNNGQTDVPALSNPTQVSLGYDSTCALDDNGVVCWGLNHNGQTDVPALMIDPDKDGFSNQIGADSFPFDPSASKDSDGDGLPDSWNDGKSEASSTSNPKLTLDLDDDNDGVEDTVDSYPLDSLYSSDSDGDGMPDAWELKYALNPNDPSDAESDTDNDTASALQEFVEGTIPSIDTDSDSIYNHADLDDDNDGVPDALDAFPLKNTESVDSDGDGVGDNDERRLAFAALEIDINRMFVFAGRTAMRLMDDLDDLLSLGDSLTQPRGSTVDLSFPCEGDVTGGYDFSFTRDFASFTKGRGSITSENCTFGDDSADGALTVNGTANFEYDTAEWRASSPQTGYPLKFTFSNLSITDSNGKTLTYSGSLYCDGQYNGISTSYLDGHPNSIYNIQYGFSILLGSQFDFDSSVFTTDSLQRNDAGLTSSYMIDADNCDFINVNVFDGNSSHTILDAKYISSSDSFDVYTISAGDEYSGYSIDSQTRSERLSDIARAEDALFDFTWIGSLDTVLRHAEFGDLHYSIYGPTEVYSLGLIGFARDDYNYSLTPFVSQDRDEQSTVYFNTSTNILSSFYQPPWENSFSINFPLFENPFGISRANTLLYSTLQLSDRCPFNITRANVATREDSSGEYTVFEELPRNSDGSCWLSAFFPSDYGDYASSGFYTHPAGKVHYQDVNLDGLNELFSADDDQDGTRDSADAFPLDPSESVDTDGDGVGNNADLDDDNDRVPDVVELTDGTDPLLSDTDSDGYPDDIDALPLISGEHLDTDGDGIGNGADPDDDNDGVDDINDQFALDASESVDSDGDGIGDNADLFDNNPAEWFDTDLNGVGNNEDEDDDGDGFSDAQEALDGTDPLDKDDCATCTPPVSGIAYHWNVHALMESVDVNLVGMTDGVANGVSQEATSNTSGLYAFAEKQRGTNHMTVSKVITDDESGNVISSADALAALKIAVGINPNADPDGAGPEEALPVSPYQYIAADVNMDGRVTSADALDILKMAVNLGTAKPRQWVFVAEDYNFWDESTKSFTTTRSDVTWDRDGMIFEYPEKSTQNLIGVLMGDVNGNWSAPEESETVGESYLKDLVASQGGSLAQWGLTSPEDVGFTSNNSEESGQSVTSEQITFVEELTDGTATLSQNIDGTLVDREYIVKVPGTMTKTKYPVVFFFHGGGGNGSQWLNQGRGVTDLIDREEFIGIFPSGYNGRWNVGGQTSADDIEFISSIINVLSGADIFDTENIYGIGTSNGGGMVNKLAKETSIFRAIAPVISSQTALLGELVPSQPVSVFQVNAENDSAIPLQGGQGVGNQEFMSAQASAENWATNFNCNLTPVSEPVAWGDYSGTEHTFNSCINDERVRYVVVDGAGHSPNFGSGFNLYERIWQFFESGDDL